MFRCTTSYPRYERAPPGAMLVPALRPSLTRAIHGSGSACSSRRGWSLIPVWFCGQVELEIVPALGIVGELALLDRKQHYLTSAVAIGPTQVWVCTSHVFQRLFGRWSKKQVRCQRPCDAPADGRVGFGGAPCSCCSTHSLHTPRVCWRCIRPPTRRRKSRSCDCWRWHTCGGTGTGSDCPWLVSPAS